MAWLLYSFQRPMPAMFSVREVMAQTRPSPINALATLPPTASGLSPQPRTPVPSF